MSGVQLTLGSRNEVATGVCLLRIVPPVLAETGKTAITSDEIDKILSNRGCCFVAIDFSRKQVISRPDFLLSV